MELAFLVGQNIQFLRKARNMTQLQLKDAAKMTVESLRKIDYGEVPRTTIVPLTKIANALQVDIGVLFSPNIKEESLESSAPISAVEVRERIIRQIQFYRSTRGVSQEKLDEYVTGETAIMRLEKRKMYPNILQLEDIAAFFEIDAQALVQTAVSSTRKMPSIIKLN